MKYLILWVSCKVDYFSFLFHYIIFYAGEGWKETGLIQFDCKLKNKFRERCLNGKGRVGSESLGTENCSD